MRRLLHHAGIVIFLGTMVTLLVFHTHLMRTNHQRNEKISMLQRSVLHYQKAEPLADLEQETGDPPPDYKPYSDILIPDENPGRQDYVEDHTRQFTPIIQELARADTQVNDTLGNFKS